jgi:hypothetical protein
MPEVKDVERTDTDEQCREPETKTELDFVDDAINWVSLQMNWSPAKLILVFVCLYLVLITVIIHSVSK